MTYAEWQNTYFTACNAQFISVSDPRRPPLRPIKLIGQTRMTQGGNLISPDDALDMANRGLQAHLRSGQQCPLTPTLQGTRPVSAHLVQRLDRRDEFYYLIVMHQDDRPAAIVRGDGLHGTFQGALSLDGVTRSPIIAPDDAVAAARQAVIDRHDGHGRIVLRDGAFSLHPTLVWRPCQESRSPYYPFYEIAVGADTIYVGYDGRVYPILHDLGRG